MKSLSLLGALLLALLPLAPLVAAYNENEAAAVREIETGRSDVVRVWHEPTVIQPGTQWHGYIQFTGNASVNSVRYQICHVGYSCFAPPTAANQLNATTWAFDTRDYKAAGIGQPVKWEAGWRVGFKFILNETTPNGPVETAFPNATADPNDLEHHYLAFEMPPAPKSSAAPAMLFVTGLLVVSAAFRRG